MVTDRPIASLTGQEDWEWNECREGDAASDATAGSTEHRRGHRIDHGDHPPDPDAREAALRREIRDLEAELDRTERRLQCVIDRYERLLAEKNRRLNEDPHEGDDGSLPYLSAVFPWRAD